MAVPEHIANARKSLAIINISIDMSVKGPSHNNPVREALPSPFSYENKAPRKHIPCPIEGSDSDWLCELHHSFCSLFKLPICEAKITVTFSLWSFFQSDMDRPTFQLCSFYYYLDQSQTPKDFSEKGRLEFLTKKAVNISLILIPIVTYICKFCKIASVLN